MANKSKYLPCFIETVLSYRGRLPLRQCAKQMALRPGQVSNIWRRYADAPMTRQDKNAMMAKGQARRHAKQRPTTEEN